MKAAASEAASFKEAGFRAVKIKVNNGGEVDGGDDGDYDDCDDDGGGDGDGDDNSGDDDGIRGSQL